MCAVPQAVPEVHEIRLANAWGGTFGHWFCLLFVTQSSVRGTVTSQCALRPGSWGPRLSDLGAATSRQGRGRKA